MAVFIDDVDMNRLFNGLPESIKEHYRSIDVYRPKTISKVEWTIRITFRENRPADLWKFDGFRWGRV